MIQSILLTILILYILFKIRAKLILKYARRELEAAKLMSYKLVNTDKSWEEAFTPIRKFNFWLEVSDLTKWTHKQFFPNSPIYWTEEKE